MYDTLSTQLHCFVHGMTQAISHVTHLDLDMFLMGAYRHSSHGLSTDSLSVLLSSLAPSCTTLQHLCVVGFLGRSLLGAFGTYCSKLASLEVTSQYRHTLQQLHMILPGLTHCTFKPCNSKQFYQESLYEVLSCVSLTSINMGTIQISKKIWQALPDGLVHLTCSAPEDLLMSLKDLSCLLHFIMHCESCNNGVFLTSLMAMLQAASALQTLKMLGTEHTTEQVITLCGSCTSAGISDIAHLNTLIQAGLDVDFLSIHDGKQVCTHDVMLDICGFHPKLFDLNPIPAVTCLSLQDSYEFPKHAFQGISTVFPNLEYLCLKQLDPFSNCHLLPLVKCSKLRCLKLADMDMSPIGVTMLCSYLPLLEGLIIEDCTDLDQAGVAHLQDVVDAWGVGAQINQEH